MFVDDTHLESGPYLSAVSFGMFGTEIEQIGNQRRAGLGLIVLGVDREIKTPCECRCIRWQRLDYRQAQRVGIGLAICGSTHQKVTHSAYQQRYRGLRAAYLLPESRNAESTDDNHRRADMDYAPGRIGTADVEIGAGCHETVVLAQVTQSVDGHGCAVHVTRLDTLGNPGSTRCKINRVHIPWLDRWFEFHGLTRYRRYLVRSQILDPAVRRGNRCFLGTQNNNSAQLAKFR